MRRVAVASAACLLATAGGAAGCGIEARVVRDVVTEGDEPVELTDDWYAQDAKGNVWYLGEMRRSTRTASRCRRPARSRPASPARRPA
jgi:hypothetical protein